MNEHYAFLLRCLAVFGLTAILTCFPMPVQLMAQEGETGDAQDTEEADEEFEEEITVLHELPFDLPSREGFEVVDDRFAAIALPRRRREARNQDL